VLSDSMSRVDCWGDNSASQMGRGQATASPSAPTTVQRLRDAGPMDLPTVTQIAAGGQTTCAARPASMDSRVYCWGANRDGQAGQSPAAGLQIVSYATPVNW